MGHFDDLVQDFAKDSAKENNGVWMTYGRHRYKIARAHRDNVAYLKLMEEKMRPYQWAIDRGNWGAIKDAAQSLIQEVYAETVLKSIEKLDGTVLPYTPAEGVALFKRLPDLWDEVQKFANNESHYTPDAIKADSKN